MSNERPHPPASFLVPIHISCSCALRWHVLRCGLGGGAGRCARSHGAQMPRRTPPLTHTTPRRSPPLDAQPAPSADGARGEKRAAAEDEYEAKRRKRLELNRKAAQESRRRKKLRIEELQRRCDRFELGKKRRGENTKSKLSFDQTSQEIFCLTLL